MDNGHIRQRNNGGFTLLELMIVIVILGILGAIVAPKFMDEPHKARVVQAGGGWLVQQRDLAPEGLSQMLLKLERSALVDIALKAKDMQKTNATREVVTACEELAT